MENKKNNINIKMVCVIVMIFIIIVLYIALNKFCSNHTLYFLLPELLISVIILSTIILINLTFNTKNTTDKKKRVKKIRIISTIVLLLILIIINNHNLDGYKEYTINGRKIYWIEMYIRNLSDIITADTIDIQTDDVKVINEMATINGSRGNLSYYTVYYLDINNGEYIIPFKKIYSGKTPVMDIFNNNVVEKNLLYKSAEGEKNTITVYKNSKLIKAINGVELNGDKEKLNEKINEFLKKKEYEISISIKEDKTIEYITEGCTVDEFFSKEKDKLLLGIFNEENRMVINTIIKHNDKLPTNLPDGKYRVCIIKYNGTEISNSVTYILKDGIVHIDK